MKLCIFYFSLLFATTYQQSIKDRIDALIEKLKEAIPEVIAVPTLNVELKDNKYLTGYLNASDINLKGIKELDMNITYTTGLISIPVSFILTLGDLNVDLKYLSDLALLNSSLLHIFGDGAGSVRLTDFVVQANINLSIIPLSLSLNSMQMHLDDGKFTFNGLLEDDSFSKEISDVLSNNFAKIFNLYENVLSTIVEDVINKVVADILSKNTTLIKTYEVLSEETAIDQILETYNIQDTIFEAAEMLTNIASLFISKYLTIL